MPGLWFSGFRAWGFNPARTLLTLVGLALGVSLLMGTVLAVDSLDQAIALQSQRLAGHVPLQVRALSDDGLNPDDLAALRALPGVDRATPTLEKRVFYRTAAGRGFASVLGFNPDQLGAQQDYPLADGRYVDGRAAPEVLRRVGVATERHGLPSPAALTDTPLSSFSCRGLIRIPSASGLVPPFTPALLSATVALHTDRPNTRNELPFEPPVVSGVPMSRSA